MKKLMRKEDFDENVNQDFNEIELILKNSNYFKFLENKPLSECDPYYTPPRQFYPEENWEIEFDMYNAQYEEAIKADPLRYPLILEMLEKKKELLENPIIFDKEEEYYETDPHKLVVFDEYFTPFFEKEANDAFFRNLKDPVRIKWEEIPEEERKLNIIPIEDAIRRLKYDEIQEFFDEYLISKDIVLLFLNHMQTFWPIRKFFNYIKQYVAGLPPQEIYKFFIEKVLILSATYTSYNKQPLTIESTRGINFLNIVYVLKKKLYKELTSCLEPNFDPFIAKPGKAELDIFSDFIEKYDLFEEPKYAGVSRFYKFKEITKIIILLNLSFFNIFPIEDNKEFEKLRHINKPLFLTFLWYLKDLRWKDYQSPLKLKKPIKSYFNNEEEYNKLNDLVECYPMRVVAAKEYFFTYHDVILKEEVLRKTAIYDKQQQKQARRDYRFNADFYILNLELQAYQKQKEKIYSKFRKLQKSEKEIKLIIDEAYKRHLKKQVRLNKILFRTRNSTEPKSVEARDSISFFIDDTTDIITKSYTELIAETTDLFVLTLQALELDIDLEKNEPYIYPETNLYKKIFEDKYFEPNLYNRFQDYCFIAVDRYTDQTKHISEFNLYQKEFILEFLRDIMGIWGSSYIPHKFKRILHSPSKRRRKRFL